MCGGTFNPWAVPPHFTPFLKLDTDGKKEVLVIFPLCDNCWRESDEEQKRSAYFNVWIDWQEDGHPIYYESAHGGALLSSWSLVIMALNKEINKEYMERMRVVNSPDTE